MKITLETKSGQKYLLTGEEMVKGYYSYLMEQDMLNLASRTDLKAGLTDFLSTYEKEPVLEVVKDEQCTCPPPTTDDYEHRPNRPSPMNA